MAKLSVRYSVIYYQDVDWPDDELDNLTYDTLMANLDTENSDEKHIAKICDILKNDEPFNF